MLFIFNQFKIIITKFHQFNTFFVRHQPHTICAVYFCKRNPSVIISYAKLDNSAIPPERANPSDAGYDLFSTEYVTIEPFQRKLISTGINIEIPDGFEFTIAEMASGSLKTLSGIDLPNNSGTHSHLAELHLNNSGIIRS